MKIDFVFPVKLILAFFWLDISFSHILKHFHYLN